MLVTVSAPREQVQDVVMETTRSDTGGRLEVVEDNSFVAAVTKNPLRWGLHSRVRKFEVGHGHLNSNYYRFSHSFTEPLMTR